MNRHASTAPSHGAGTSMYDYPAHPYKKTTTYIGGVLCPCNRVNRAVGYPSIWIVGDRTLSECTGNTKCG